MSGAPGHQLLEIVTREHAAGRIGRTGHDQPGETLAARAEPFVEQPGGRLEFMLMVGRQAHRLEIERHQDVAIGRIAGIGEGHPVTRIERRQKREQEGTGRAGGDDDALGRHLDPVGLAIVAGDTLAQRRDA